MQQKIMGPDLGVILEMQILSGKCVNLRASVIYLRKFIPNKVFALHKYQITVILSDHSPAIIVEGNYNSDGKKVTMTQEFIDLERQFCEHFANLSQKCMSARLLTEEQKKQIVSEIAGQIGEAEALMSKMDVEARSMGSSVKATLLVKIREYRTDLNKLKTELKRLGSSNANRAELSGLAGLAAMQGSTDQSGRLMMSDTTVHGMNENVARPRRKKIVIMRIK